MLGEIQVLIELIFVQLITRNVIEKILQLPTEFIIEKYFQNIGMIYELDECLDLIKAEIICLY